MIPNSSSFRGRIFLSLGSVFLLFGCNDVSALLTPLPRPASVFSASQNVQSVESLKSQILQLGASLDRGQAYNPTSGSYYADRMAVARFVIFFFPYLDETEVICVIKAKTFLIRSYLHCRSKIESLNSLAPPAPTSLDEIAGEWELVLSTVPHGIFRSSPFFLAIQEAFAAGGEPEKANLFFQLHELQVMSWGASKIGRVAQVSL